MSDATDRSAAAAHTAPPPADAPDAPGAADAADASGPRRLAALVWPLLVLAAATVGGWGSASAGRFYALLDKPLWAPPAWLFGPVWTLLYTLMALAAWQVARQPSRWRVRALSAFAVQLLFNAAWSWCFFAWHDGALAMAVLIGLWCALALSAALFAAVRPLAAALLLPTLGWVSFAGALNLAVWLRNPTLLG